MESVLQMRSSLSRLRRLGTVWSLEAERARAAQTGEIYERFAREVDEMDRSIELATQEMESARRNGHSSELTRMLESWSSLVERVGSLARRLDEVSDR